MRGFPTRAPAELEARPRARRWMVEALWSEQAVGGEPKCGKSFLALDLAVAVAVGVPCLRHFHAARSGAVLLFAAEDAGHIVRARLEGIAKAAGAAFDSLDLAVIDVPALRLDHRAARQRLLETVQRVSPRLLVLDPLVRLHRVDEKYRRRRRPHPRLRARPPAPLPRRRPARPSRTKERRLPARSGAARQQRAARLGRQQCVPAPARPPESS